MTLSEFINQLRSIESDMAVYGHPRLCDSLNFYIRGGDDLVLLKLDRIEVDFSLGCGCVVGANVEFSLDEENYRLEEVNESSTD